MLDKKLEEPQILFFVVFSLVTWIFTSFVLLNQNIFDILYYFHSNKTPLGLTAQDKEIPVIITNPKTEKEKEDKLNPLYRSNKFLEGRGKITQKKGFKWLSEQDRLVFKKQTSLPNIQKRSKKLTARIIDTQSPSWQRIFQKQMPQLTRIPDSYNFNYEKAFSWDKNGLPQIPSYHYKYYDYIKTMMEKIRRHWSPPGGFPSPLYGNNYHKSYLVPGYFRMRLFPPQEIGIVFMLDKEGYVIDIRVSYSAGYRNLDNSIVEAIRNADNFGSPPKEMLKRQRALFPWLFKIY